MPVRTAEEVKGHYQEDGGGEIQNIGAEKDAEQGDNSTWKGWLGVGPPRRAPFMGRSKPFADGWGLVLSWEVGAGSRKGTRIGS